MSLIYEPQEDSYLFVNFLNDYFSGKNNYSKSVLDMGCGSCILSDKLRDLGFSNILCVDINSDCVKLAQKKGFEAVQSNLFQNINKKFDYILFNPPYLPFDEREDKESQLITTGGLLGDELISIFLREVKKYLKDNGRVFLLVSDLTPMKEIENYNFKIVAEKKIFFEKLIILEINFND